MAGGDNGFSSRTITEDRNHGEEQAGYALIFKHFRENKVEIASAITKPFPFLMSLRDRGFVSEQKYRHFQERCENLVPVNRVMYDVLSDLEEMFCQPLLSVVFSRTNLTAYPDLKEILRSFPVVVQEKICTQPSHMQVTQGPSLPMIEGRQPEDTLMLPYGREGVSYSSGHSPRSDQEAKPVLSIQPPSNTGGLRDDSPKPNAQKVLLAAPSTPACEEGPRAVPPQVPSDPAFTLDAFKAPRIAEPRGACLEVRKGACKNTISSPPRSRSVSCGPGSSQKNVQDAGEGPSQPRGSRGDTVDAGNSSVLRKPRRRRSTRKRKNEDVDFGANSLPVTCGELKGILYKEILQQGISMKCIQSEDGEWFTPPEFEIRGGYARSKNWRLSIRCYEMPLKRLIERNLLPDPSGKCHRKRKGTAVFYFVSQMAPNNVA